MEKFSYEKNGYNREEVNTFVIDVIQNTEGIINRVKQQNIEIERLKKELLLYKSIEETLKNAITKVEQIQENQRATLEEKKEEIIKEAKENASKILNETLKEAEEIEKKTSLYQKKLNILIEKQISISKEIEDLNIDGE